MQMKKIIGTDINNVKITSLSDVIGQIPVIDILRLYIRAHCNIRMTTGIPDVPFGPILFTGPSGTGKTMTVKAIHADLGNLHLIETNGEAVNKKSELFSILINADMNTTVFIDESHGMNSKTQNLLLTALSEKILYVPTGQSSGNSHSIPLANFTMILATTHEYQLKDALRNRMRIHCRFEYYTEEELVEIVRQRIKPLNWKYESDDVLKMIAQRAKKTPRLALNRNLQTCWHVTQSHDRELITIDDAKEAFSHLQIDAIGLDHLDRSYLNVLFECDKTSLGVLSSKLSLPGQTIQRVVEPYLLREGFIIKDKSLRMITQKGRKHVMTTSNQILEDTQHDH